MPSFHNLDLILVQLIDLTINRPIRGHRSLCYLRFSLFAEIHLLFLINVYAVAISERPAEAERRPVHCAQDWVRLCLFHAYMLDKISAFFVSNSP
jgi:hypothetical protein